MPVVELVFGEFRILAFEIGIFRGYAPSYASLVPGKIQKRPTDFWLGIKHLKDISRYEWCVGWSIVKRVECVKNGVMDSQMGNSEF